MGSDCFSEQFDVIWYLLKRTKPSSPLGSAAGILAAVVVEVVVSVYEQNTYYVSGQC